MSNNVCFLVCWKSHYCR